MLHEASLGTDCHRLAAEPESANLMTERKGRMPLDSARRPTRPCQRVWVGFASLGALFDFLKDQAGLQPAAKNAQNET